MAFTPADVEDVDFVDAVELASDGASSYKTITVQSTTAPSTISITTTPPLNLDGFVYGDDPVEPGEKVTLAGTSAADGDYTIATVTDNNNITVVEPIVSSTGGTGSVSRPSGASLVGVDPVPLTHVSSNDVQAALVQLDAAIATGGGVNVNDEGTPVTGTPHTTLNFTGTGVAATDAGAGVVDITITGDIHHESFDVTFPEGHDEVLGVVSSLSATPAKVFPSEPLEVGTTVWSGVRWALAIRAISANGFEWALRVLDEPYWAGPGSTTVRIPYLWIDAPPITNGAGQVLVNGSGTPIVVGV